MKSEWDGNLRDIANEDEYLKTPNFFGNKFVICPIKD